MQSLSGKLCRVTGAVRAIAAAGGTPILTDIVTDTLPDVVPGAPWLRLDVRSEADWAAAALFPTRDVLVNNAGITSVEAGPDRATPKPPRPPTGARSSPPIPTARSSAAARPCGRCAGAGARSATSPRGPARAGWRCGGLCCLQGGSTQPYEVCRPPRRAAGHLLQRDLPRRDPDADVGAAAGDGPDRPARMAEAIASTPIARFGTPEQVAAAAVRLASDAAAYVTGTEAVIDGGRLAGVASS